MKNIFISTKISRFENGFETKNVNIELKFAQELKEKLSTNKEFNVFLADSKEQEPGLAYWENLIKPKLDNTDIFILVAFRTIVLNERAKLEFKKHLSNYYVEEFEYFKKSINNRNNSQKIIIPVISSEVSQNKNKITYKKFALSLFKYKYEEVDKDDFDSSCQSVIVNIITSLNNLINYSNQKNEPSKGTMINSDKKSDENNNKLLNELYKVHQNVNFLFDNKKMQWLLLKEPFDILYNVKTNFSNNYSIELLSKLYDEMNYNKVFENNTSRKTKLDKIIAITKNYISIYNQLLKTMNEDQINQSLYTINKSQFILRDHSEIKELINDVVKYKTLITTFKPEYHKIQIFDYLIKSRFIKRVLKKLGEQFANDQNLVKFLSRKFNKKEVKKNLYYTEGSLFKITKNGITHFDFETVRFE